ncbi:unnamed protein product, partial [Allacma fusca]
SGLGSIVGVTVLFKTVEDTFVVPVVFVFSLVTSNVALVPSIIFVVVCDVVETSVVFFELLTVSCIVFSNVVTPAVVFVTTITFADVLGNSVTSSDVSDTGVFNAVVTLNVVTSAPEFCLVDLRVSGFVGSVFDTDGDPDEGSIEEVVVRTRSVECKRTGDVIAGITSVDGWKPGGNDAFAVVVRLFLTVARVTPPSVSPLSVER